MQSLMQHSMNVAIFETQTPQGDTAQEKILWFLHFTQTDELETARDHYKLELKNEYIQKPLKVIQG